MIHCYEKRKFVHCIKLPSFKRKKILKKKKIFGVFYLLFEILIKKIKKKFFFKLYY